MRRSLVALAFFVSMTPAHADDAGTTTSVVPGSTVVTVVPNSTVVTVVPNSTVVTLAPGATLPPGATLSAPPGFGAPGTTAITGDPSKSTAPATTMSAPVEVTEAQMASLPADQRAAMEAALAKAQASMPAVQQGPNIPSSISGLTPEMLAHLTPEQLQMVEEAKTTGAIPAGLKGMLANINDIPGEVYAKLSPDQKAVLDKARASGNLDKSMLHDILDGLTPEEVKAFSAGKTVSTASAQKAAAKRSITCVSGKKSVTLVASSCPKGFTKK